MQILFNAIDKVRRILTLGFYVLGGELLHTATSLFAKDKAEVLHQDQLKRRQEKFGLNPDSTTFF